LVFSYFFSCGRLNRGAEQRIHPRAATAFDVPLGV
jgi:hypothetical protein